MYSIEELIKTFEENGMICKKENDLLIEDFKQKNPNEPIPEWFTRDFCINTALAAICKEIDKLRIDFGGWK